MRIDVNEAGWRGLASEKRAVEDHGLRGIANHDIRGERTGDISEPNSCLVADGQAEGLRIVAWPTELQHHLEQQPCSGPGTETFWRSINFESDTFSRCRIDLEQRDAFGELEVQANRALGRRWEIGQLGNSIWFVLNIQGGVASESLLLYAQDV